MLIIALFKHKCPPNLELSDLSLLLCCCYPVYLSLLDWNANSDSWWQEGTQKFGLFTFSKTKMWVTHEKIKWVWVNVKTNNLTINVYYYCMFYYDSGSNKWHYIKKHLKKSQTSLKILRTNAIFFIIQSHKGFTIFTISKYVQGFVVYVCILPSIFT